MNRTLCAVRKLTKCVEQDCANTQKFFPIPQFNISSNKNGANLEPSETKSNDKLFLLMNDNADESSTDGSMKSKEMLRKFDFSTKLIMTSSKKCVGDEVTNSMKDNLDAYTFPLKSVDTGLDKFVSIVSPNNKTLAFTVRTSEEAAKGSKTKK